MANPRRRYVLSEIPRRGRESLGKRFAKDSMVVFSSEGHAPQFADILHKTYGSQFAIFKKIHETLANKKVGATMTLTLGKSGTKKYKFKKVRRRDGEIVYVMVSREVTQKRPARK